jgi:hypothetical protein
LELDDLAQFRLQVSEKELRDERAVIEDLLPRG